MTEKRDKQKKRGRPVPEETVNRLTLEGAKKIILSYSTSSSEDDLLGRMQDDRFDQNLNKECAVCQEKYNKMKSSSHCIQCVNCMTWLREHCVNAFLQDVVDLADVILVFETAGSIKAFCWCLFHQSLRREMLHSFYTLVPCSCRPTTIGLFLPPLLEQLTRGCGRDDQKSCLFFLSI